MQNNVCTRNCWITAGVVGLLVWIFTSGIGQTSLMGGLFLGLIATVLLGLFLVWALCQGNPAEEEAAEAAAPAVSLAPATGGSVALKAAEPAAGDAASRADEQRKADARAQQEVRKRAQNAEKKAEDAVKASKPGKSNATVSLASTAGEVKARKAAPKAAAAPASKDDLKQIKGVGPKLEGILHENGVTSFAQIAAWGDAEIDEFAAEIGSMGGRIRSDDWVAQAKTLASGGETEFSARVEKGDVY